MKLTGKCKQDFLKYLGSDKRLEIHLPDMYLNALIIDFFDSMEIRVFPYPIAASNSFDAVIQFNDTYEALNVRLSRQEAIDAAICEINTNYGC